MIFFLGNSARYGPTILSRGRYPLSSVTTRPPTGEMGPPQAFFQLFPRPLHSHDPNRHADTDGDRQLDGLLGAAHFCSLNGTRIASFAAMIAAWRSASATGSSCRKSAVTILVMAGTISGN